MSASASAPRPAPSPRVGVPAPVLVLGAIASVQVGSAVAKGLFDRAGPTGTVLLRLVFSALALVAVSRPGVRSWRRRTLGLAALFGISLAAMNWSFYQAIDRIPLGVAVTVEFVGPLTVAVVGSRRPLDVGWAVLAGAGVALLTGGGGQVAVAGILLALLAGAFWAAYILLSQRVGRAVPGLQGLAVALVVGAVVLAPAGALAEGGRLLHPGVLGTGLAVATLSSAVPYSLELAALRRLPAAVFGVLMSLEPAMAALAGFVVLGERLHPRELVAILLVSLASAGATLTHPRRAGRSSSG